MKARLRFAAALSTLPDGPAAIDEVCQKALTELTGAADLAMVFLSPHYGSDFQSLAGRLCDRLGTETLLGCTAESLVGNDREIEGEPAISLWLATLPDVSVTPLHLDFQPTVEGATFSGWPDELSDDWPAGAAMLLLGEPYSFPADELIRRLNEDRPGVPVLGGMASGGQGPRENRLILGRSVYDTGAVAAVIHGRVRVRSVVSQGCRPIGRPLIVTKAERNVIYELSGRPALVQLQEIFSELTPDEQRMVRSGLHVGLVFSEYRDAFRRGDFLIRNVTGSDPNSGAIAIGDFVRVGQTVQFHVRDAASADEDLREMLSAAAADGSSNPRGALLFTCNGRGTRLFPQPHHDAACVRQALPNIPLAGLFAAGEIGPVAGQNFLHGFTASLALFETPTDD